MNIVEVADLSLRYGSQQVLDHISFSFPRSKIIGLLGPNGAGKSSIIKILAGLVYPASGTLNFEGSPMAFSELRDHCGYLIDYPSFYPYLTGMQNLQLIGRINGRQDDLEEILRKVGLANAQGKRVRHYSTGMKQRLAIAAAMLRESEVLILDEPFNGLDPNGFQDLIALLRDLNARGVTIVVSSHLLNELEQFADNFILLHKGSIALDIDKENLRRAKKKVAFSFENAPSIEAHGFMDRDDTVFESPLKAVLHLYPDEIAGTVQELVRLQSTPVNVETQNLLQEKYLEITR